MANPKPTTSAKQWKKRTGGVEVELPSGNVCKVKRPGMEKLLSAGVIPDRLTPIAMEAIKKGEGGAPVDDQKVMEEFLQDQEAVNDIFSAFDKVTEMCVVEPKVLWHKRLKGEDQNGKKVFEEIPEEEREDDLLYTDDIDMEDKTFIFNFVVGGSSDLESFRREHGKAVADLQPRQDVEGSSE